MNRILYLDILRIFACIMIIFMHAPIPDTGLSSFVLASDSFLTTPGIGLFIMVSGALLLPIKTNTKKFLERRLSKVVGPTITWTSIYWFSSSFISGEFKFYNFISVPFSAQFNGVLWFMYMLIGLYLIAPILSGWLQRSSKREVEFYLCLWGVTMCYPLIRNFVTVNEGTTGILYYFGGYAGYFLLGYYLHHYHKQLSLLLCSFLFITPMIIAGYCRFFELRINFYDFFYYLSIITVMSCIAWYMFIRHFSSEYNENSINHRVLAIISKCTFGIYLSHILVMRYFLWNLEIVRGLHGFIQIATTTILTFIGGFLITWIIGYLPFANYIVGFSHKR